METTGTRTAKDVMTPDPICVSPSDPIPEVARVFDDNGISGAPVIDVQGRLIGIVSKTDLLHQAIVGPAGSRPGSFFELMAEGFEAAGGGELGAVEDVMTVDAVIAAAHEPVSILARRLVEERVHRLVVVDDTQRPIGVITTLDVLNTFPG